MHEFMETLAASGRCVVISTSPVRNRAKGAKHRLNRASAPQPEPTPSILSLTTENYSCFPCICVTSYFYYWGTWDSVEIIWHRHVHMAPEGSHRLVWRCLCEVTHVHFSDGFCSSGMLTAQFWCHFSQLACPPCSPR